VPLGGRGLRDRHVRAIASELVNKTILCNGWGAGAVVGEVTAPRSHLSCPQGAGQASRLKTGSVALIRLPRSWTPQQRGRDRREVSIHPDPHARSGRPGDIFPPLSTRPDRVYRAAQYLFPRPGRGRSWCDTLTSRGRKTSLAIKGVSLPLLARVPDFEDGGDPSRTRRAVSNPRPRPST